MKAKRDIFNRVKAQAGVSKSIRIQTSFRLEPMAYHYKNTDNDVIMK